MKRLIFLLLATLASTTAAYAQDLTADDALQTFSELIEPSDDAAGFHSIDMFSLYKISDAEPRYADQNCVRFTQVMSKTEGKVTKTKPRCFEHSDIKKLTVIPKEKAQYGAHWVGDFHVLVLYKQMGRLIIVGLSDEDVDPFVEAVRVLSPSLKKVKFVN